MTDLTGKRALVTGASKGIGRGIAEAFAEAGATVGVNHPPDAAEREAAETVAETIRDAGGQAVALEGDVSDAADVAAMVDAFEERFGNVTHLVNNAGVVGDVPLVEMDPEEWDRVLSVNLRGVYLTTHYALPGMLENGSGKIINVASQLGIVGSKNLVHYCASKGGVIAFTRALAHELAPDVTVNAIAPGAISTDLGAELDTSRPLSEIPLGRYGDVEDVVPTALFLAGAGGDYYTGQTLSPDGGDAMH